jgi:3-hydroxyacyl-CoA dehydrogenase
MADQTATGGVAGIVGSGLIGRAWAHVFARAGWRVIMWDPDPATRSGAPSLVAASLHDLARHGLVDRPDAAAARVTSVETMAEAVAGADLVQESGPETVDAKRAIYAELDAAAPRTTVLASSTSAIVASLFTEGLAGRDRCLVAHPVNPPHLVPIVELCPSPWTSDATLQRARNVYTVVGQVPILVNREIEGFVLNRLQGALLAEAFRLVGEGAVTPQDLDETVRNGLGLRWSFMGPFETIELNAPGGMADYCARYTGFYRRLQEQPAPATVWDEANWRKVVAAWGGAPTAEGIADKSRWRNERLAALAAHKSKKSPFKT